jgi:hypothetical protein
MWYNYGCNDELWLYEVDRKVFWTGVRISPPPPKGNL